MPSSERAFLLPVEGLTVESVWTVGAVRFHTSESAAALIDAKVRHLVVHPVMGDMVQETLDHMGRGTIAEVDAANIDEALALTRQATDALRVFQQARLALANTTAFGLPGEVGRSSLRYVDTGRRGGPGFKNSGPAIGWTFNDDAHDQWRASQGFSWLSQVMATLTPANEGARRAALGIQLLSQAILDPRPALKLLSVVVVESMLVERMRSSESLLLARRVAFFGCGRRPTVPSAAGTGRLARTSRSIPC